MKRNAVVAIFDFDGTLTKRDVQNQKKVKLISLSYPKVHTFQDKSSIGVGMRIRRVTFFSSL